MKVVATINFKGGVGKTTITWLLARVVSEKFNKRVLVVDADAQMSLTLALSLVSGTGNYVKGFGDWYDNKYNKGHTILDALDAYDRYAQGSKRRFDFPIDRRFIWKVTDSLYFIPSTTELYWLELEVFSRENVKGFIKAILGKIQHSRKTPVSPDYVFFDCPPNFTALSYSILSNCSLILIPVNPDVFASRGVTMMLDGLMERIQPWPNPLVAVIQNKVRTWRGPTRESRGFMVDVKDTVAGRESGGKPVYVCNTYIPERADIRKAINFGRSPKEYGNLFEDIWRELGREQYV